MLLQSLHYTKITNLKLKKPIILFSFVIVLVIPLPMMKPALYKQPGHFSENDKTSEKHSFRYCLICMTIKTAYFITIKVIVNNNIYQKYLNSQQSVLKKTALNSNTLNKKCGSPVKLPHYALRIML